MALDILAHLCSAVTSADEAWRKVSSSGLSHISMIISFIDALHADASNCIEQAPVGALSSHHMKANESIQSLRTMLRRLRSIIAGLERWLPEIDTSHPVMKIANQFVTELKLDFEAKESVLTNISNAIKENRKMDQTKIDLWMATWIEQVARTDHAAADVVIATVEANELLECFKRVVKTTPDADMRKSFIDYQGESPVAEKAKVSPALAMLKGKGKKKR